MGLTCAIWVRIASNCDAQLVMDKSGAYEETTCFTTRFE